MLSQQSEIEFQTSNKTLTTNHTNNRMNEQISTSYKDTTRENTQIDNNCNSNALNSKGNCPFESNTQIKLRRLQQLYNQSNQKLKSLNIHNGQQYQHKSQAKALLEAQIGQFLNPHKETNSKARKGSQTSTAGEDEQIKGKVQESEGRADQNKVQNDIQSNRLKQQSLAAGNNQLFEQLQKKLHKVRHQNQEVKEKGQKRIQQLKAALQKGQFPYSKSTQNQLQQNQQYTVILQLQSKANLLSQQKASLSQQHSTLQQKTLELKRSIIHFSNSAQYLRSTQNCCQQILNEELCSFQYKIEGRKLEYDSNKRYLDKVIRTRKYEDNVSFDDLKAQIAYLNDLCEEMMDRKTKYLTPDIKKYKQKRMHIMELIQEVKQKFNQLENNKQLLELQTKEQNKIFDELQDQYCALLEKADDINLSKTQELSSQEKLNQLKFKKTQLQDGLKDIMKKYQQIKTQIDTDQTLIPSNIVKQVKKKTQRKKQQLRDSEILTKQNALLQKQNKLLSQQQDKIQWRSKPQIQHLNREEKQLRAAINVLEESFKILRENNDTLEGKMKKIEEQEKLRKEEASTQPNQQKADMVLKERQQQQKQQKEEQQTKLTKGSKLIDRLRQKQQGNFKEQQKEKKITKQPKQPTNSKQTTKGKRGKHSGKGSQMSDSRRDFFVLRENPLENLRSDFPLNRSQETSKNLSLLQSNPALYMFFIYLTVVIPGLSIGYCLRG